MMNLKTFAGKIRPFMIVLLLAFASDPLPLLARFTMALAGDASVDLESMTFLSAWVPSGRVTLSRGEYREPAAPGSASEIVVRLTDKSVFGLVNGRQVGAVIITTTTGGTGTFYELALLIRDGTTWVNTNVAYFGDRVNMHTLEIEDNAFVIAMTTQGPKDPMCCPTLRVTKRFAVQEKRLVPVAEGKKGEEPQLTGVVWQWEQTLYNNDTRVDPAKPANYTIRFLTDGKINVKADCNVKGGEYSTEGKRLSIEITHSTMAACEEGSLQEQFVRDLTGGAIFFFRGDELYIDIKYDTGTMRFSQQKEAQK